MNNAYELDKNVLCLDNAQIYQQQFLVLHHVHLSIQKGEFVFLIGATGSGKSSFLKVLYGDLPLRKGEGQICGFDLANLSKTEIPFLRRKIGIIFQDFQLLNDRTVFENLAFVLKATGWTDKSAINERIKEVLSLVGVATKDFKMPYELSGGEQQRVVIARAMLNKPDLIIADEPTGNLDPEKSDNILNILYQIQQRGTSILMATHDYRLLNRFEARILKVANGEISEISQAEFAHH